MLTLVLQMLMGQDRKIHPVSTSSEAVEKAANRKGIKSWGWELGSLEEEMTAVSVGSPWQL